MNQTFEEKQTAMFCTMQSLMHQIESASHDKRYKFNFKVECEKFYKVLEKVCEGFTEKFNGSEETTNSFIQIVSRFDELAESIKITDKRKLN